MSRPAETLRLIHELIDGSIGKDDFARLQDILLQDPDARRDYYALVCTDQLLVDTYEMPDHLAAHAKVVPHPAVKRRKLLKVFAAAAAVLIAGVLTTMMIRANRPRVTMTGSADSHFLIDGKEATSRFWKKGEVLEVRDGVVVALLNPSAEACIDGAASLRLASNDGDLELRRGRTFFRAGPASPPFTVDVAGARLRHLGTDFGVRAIDDGSCDIHVMTGSVEIQRGGHGKLTLSAGESASWRDGGPTRRTALEAIAFRQSLPAEHVLFDDDFSEPAGTKLADKKPDHGKPWKVLEQQLTTYAGGGRLDTSGGFRHLGAVFLDPPPGPGGEVVLMSLTTSPPAVIGDKKTRRSGIERLTLMDEAGKRICSLVALAREDHCWRLRDDASGQESGLTRVSALEAHTVTLRYDTVRGKITLHAGTSAQGETLAELATDAKARPASLELWNDYGGDMAMTRLAVKQVRYP